MKKFCAVLTFLLIGVCALCAKGRIEQITVAMDIGKGDSVTLNPYVASDSSSVLILQNLYEGLYEYDSATSRPVPALAQKTEVSEDGLVWTFTLENCFFSDGSPITSETFAKSWRYLQSSTLANALSLVESFETPDPRTLVVRLKHAASYFPSVLCQPCLAAADPDNSTRYSGAYTVFTRTDDEIVLTYNTRYREKVGCRRIRILITPDGDFSQDFAAGDIHWSMAFVDNAADYLEVSPAYGTSFFYFSSASGLYADSSMQRALARLVPTDYIRQIENSVMPSYSLVPESGAKALYRGTLSSDIANAFVGNSINSNSDIPVLKIAVHRGDWAVLAGQLIQETWAAALKSTVTLDTVPITVYTSDPAENPYDFCLLTWIADYLDPQAFLSMFRSDSSYNLARFSNSEYDRILDEAEQHTGSERQVLLLKAEQILLDSGTIIPVSTAISANYVRSDLLEGWSANLLDIHPFKKLSLKAVSPEPTQAGDQTLR